LTHAGPQTENEGARPLVTIAHDAVPGRLRLRITGLKGARQLKRALEGALRGAHSIAQVDASVATGSLLLLFDPLVATAAVIGAVEDVPLRYFRGGSASARSPARRPGISCRSKRR
jgi:hypothetical protein